MLALLLEKCMITSGFAPGGPERHSLFETGVEEKLLQGLGRDYAAASATAVPN
jgi:hypothetical protein